MNISLTPQSEQFIQEQVKSGKYSSANEVVGEALRLLWERESDRSLALAELKAKIRVGIEAADRGEVVDGEELFAELEEDSRRIEAEMEQEEKATK